MKNVKIHLLESGLMKDQQNDVDEVDIDFIMMPTKTITSTDNANDTNDMKGNDKKSLSETLYDLDDSPQLEESTIHSKMPQKSTHLQMTHETDDEEDADVRESVRISRHNGMTSNNRNISTSRSRSNKNVPAQSNENKDAKNRSRKLTVIKP